MRIWGITMIKLKKTFQNPGFINYIIRFVEKTGSSEKTIYKKECNWRKCNNIGRFDSIISKNFNNDILRSYFVDFSYNPLNKCYIQAYNELLQERALIPNIECFLFEFNFNVYEKKNPDCFESLKDYYYIDVQDKQHEKGLTLEQEKEIQQILDNVEDKSKILGFRYPSKFISKTLPFFNVVILNNNPLYDILIRNLYLNSEVYYHL